MAMTRLSEQEIEKAAQAYGTPLYLYDLDGIAKQFSHLSESLPESFTVHYALKANSNLTVCQTLAELGAAVDVSSVGELETALKSGFSPKSVVFTGPGKTREELDFALSINCGLIVVESLRQATVLNELAHQKGQKQKILVRINPLYRTGQSCDVQQQCSLPAAQDIQTITKSSSKFGLDEEVAIEGLNEIVKLEALELKGIHIYTESNVLNYQDLLLSWSNTVQIADRLRKDGYPISILDFGGGIGVSYASEKADFNVVQFGQEMENILNASEHDYQCIVEIGRYLLGEAGYYIAEVVDTKESRDSLFLILDGGINHLFRVSPSMKEATKFLSFLGKDQTTSKTKSATLVGKLMTSLDILAEDVSVPEDIEAGDRIVIFNCGAYGFNHSLTNFLLHNYPAEAAYANGELSLVRKRGRAQDFWLNQVFPLEQSIA